MGQKEVVAAAATCIKTLLFLPRNTIPCKVKKMQPHLSYTIPLSLSGNGKEDEIRENREGSPPCIKLSLGCGDSSHVVVKEEEKGENVKSVFTAAQFHELQLQTVIFKYIISGLPVPFHLFFTIWNSVSISLGSANGGIYKLYPTLGRFDYASMTDPEPGRCRRTDGKKWRCKRDVIPGQKYCSHHMHRGRQRSRKPVEASKCVMKSDDVSITSKRTKVYASSDDPGSNCVPARMKSASLSSTSRNSPNNGIEDSFAAPRPANSCNINGKQDNYTSCNRMNTTTCQTTASFITGKDADSKNADFNSPSKSNQRQNYGDAQNSTGLVPVLGTSAKRDLQYTIEAEPQRCRRSDGKKWRCSRTVVPHQKYCQTHMHRGAKRRTRVASGSVVVTPSKPSSDSYCHQAIQTNNSSERNLNTLLSISTLPGPQNITQDDDSNSDSTSDATTITDEIPVFVSH